MTADEPSRAPRGEPAPRDERRDEARILEEEGVLEIPLVREILVKKPVVYQVVRIRKKALTDEKLLREELRREGIEDVDEPYDAPVKGRPRDEEPR